LCAGIGMSAPAYGADTAATAPESSDLMQEITVTARRREESILDTPISISAFSGSALEARGIDRTEDLAKMVPNFVYMRP
jgi:iron complex outermembrane receptor protein